MHRCPHAPAPGTRTHRKDPMTREGKGVFHTCWFFTGTQGAITFWGSGSRAWGNRAPPAHSREALFPSASFPCFLVQCWTHLARGWVCDSRGGDLGAEGYNEPMSTPSARSPRMSAPLEDEGKRRKAGPAPLPHPARGKPGGAGVIFPAQLRPP